MGQDAKALLVFGVDFGMELPAFLRIPDPDAEEDEDGDDTFYGEHMAFDDWLCQQAGIPIPGEDGYDYKLVDTFLEGQTLKMFEYSTYDDPMYILGLRFTEQETDWSAGLAVSTVVSDADAGVLTDFLAKHGIEEKPEWILSAFYG